MNLQASATHSAARAALRPHARPASQRWLAGLIAAAALAAGLFGALHYPILPHVAGAVFVALSALAFRVPAGWLIALFALLPVVGFAPWTGWITFEETDLLVLATAAGGYGRLAVRAQAGSAGRRSERRVSVIVWLLMALFMASLLVALWRGFADAGGVRFGWFQGYQEPMNSVRLAKSFFLAALLLPLWLGSEREDPERARRWLAAGMAAGLAAASLAAVWERLAFTDLLNFSSDYRTTALFWEMHVGGVALESFLAATIPFTLVAGLAARTAIGSGAAAVVAALAGYAAVTSFSRSVYLAVPLGMAVTLVLHLLRQRRIGALAASPRGSGAGPALLLFAGFVAAAVWMFPTSGWRGLLALIGTTVVWLVSANVWTRLSLRQWLIGLAVGAALAALAHVAASTVPKGAYVVFGLGVLAALALAALRQLRPEARGLLHDAAWSLALFIAVLASLALVSTHWGGEAAAQATKPVLAAFALLTLLSCRGSSSRPVLPASLRWQVTMVCAMVLAAFVVGAFGGGAYMAGRLSAGGKDFDDRLAHWERTLKLLTTPSDWAFGKGLGRFPANFYLASTAEATTGDYRLSSQGPNAFLRLSAGSQQSDWGTLLRMTQRIAAPVGLPVARLAVRTDRDVQLFLEVCNKHLLYSSTCLSKSVTVKASPGRWRTVQTRFEGTVPSRGAWFAPALISFSLSLSTSGAVADVDNVALIDADGRELLANGDFSQEMAHWFFSSDLNHRPWHIQNLWVNVLFEQGVLGLLLLTLLSAGAFWRVSIGHGRDHVLAPAAAGALAGTAVIGVFDTMLDAPRVAMLGHFVMLLALVLRSPRPHAPAA